MNIFPICMLNSPKINQNKGIATSYQTNILQNNCKSDSVSFGTNISLEEISYLNKTADIFEETFDRLKLGRKLKAKTMIIFRALQEQFIETFMGRNDIKLPPGGNWDRVNMIKTGNGRYDVSIQFEKGEGGNITRISSQMNPDKISDWTLEKYSAAARKNQRYCQLKIENGVVVHKGPV